MECPVLLGTSSEPVDFQQFRATIKRLQYYDSFPSDGDSENQLHKIVKKQMTVSDYKDMKKNKRSVSDFPESFEGDDGDQCENETHAKKRAAINPGEYETTNSTERKSQIRQPSRAQPRKMRSIWKKASNADAQAKANASQTQPKNKSNRWFGHELRHRRWPSSPRQYSRSTDRERGDKVISKSLPYDNADDTDPSNEWLDASKGGVIQKIPAEFRPKKKLRLKIYHLRVKRKLEQMLQNINAGHRGVASALVENHRKAVGAVRGIRTRGTRQHLPRSFVIRINKKYGKDNQDEKITEGEENDEEDEEAEEEEDDDEDVEEDEDAEEEEDGEAKQAVEEGVINHKDSFKDLLRSAKEVVTNRVRFAEASEPTDPNSQKLVSRVKGKKSESEFSPKGKKVLIDANIKVDSALSDVLRYFLKTAGMVSGVKNGMPSNSDVPGGRKDSEMLRVPEHLSRSNPRFRRCRRKRH